MRVRLAPLSALAGLFLGLATLPACGESNFSGGSTKSSKGKEAKKTSPTTEPKAGPEKVEDEATAKEAEEQKEPKPSPKSDKNPKPANIEKIKTPCGDFDYSKPEGSDKKPGRIVFSHDVNIFAAMLAGTQEQQFAVNVANWLIGKKQGKILVVESSHGDSARDFDARVQNAIKGAGHSLTVTAGLSAGGSELSGYDALFVGITDPTPKFPDSQVLIDFVTKGGNIYLYGGVNGAPGVDAQLTSAFMGHYGFAYSGPFNYASTTPVSSPHPLFACVTQLGAGVGTSIKSLANAGPASKVLVSYNGEAIFAIYDGPSL